MHPLTIEKSSSPATIHARVGAARANQKEVVSSQSSVVSVNGPRITDHGHPSSIQNHNSQITNPPRFVVTLDAPLGTGDSLTRIPLAVTGKWVRDGSDFSITLGDLEEIVQNFNKRRNGEINVDYDHASEMPEVSAGGPVPSAGRIVKLDAPEEVRSQDPSIGDIGRPSSSINNLKSQINNRFILWGWYEPTGRARQLIGSREYRYISPAINWAGRDKRTGKMDGTTLTSVALTNRSFLEELPQIRLSDPAFQLVDVGEVHVDTSLGQTPVVSGQSSVVNGNGPRTTHVLLPQSSIENRQSTIHQEVL